MTSGIFHPNKMLAWRISSVPAMKPPAAIAKGALPPLDDRVTELAPGELVPDEPAAESRLIPYPTFFSLISGELQPKNTKTRRGKS
jgi:hypothetical protein